jgi:hypothetical protein
MVNFRTFVTAAHCFTFYPSPLFAFYVRCPDGKQVAVQSVHIHPRYFNFPNTNARGEIDAPYFRSINPKYDVAILETNELTSASPVTLATDEEHDSLLNRDDCHFQGFSPTRCNPNKQNCEKFASIKNIAEDYINFDTNESVLNPGDSGAGLFCRDENGRDKFVGVASSGHPEHGVVRLKNFRKFYRQIAKHQYPEQIPFSPEYLEAYRHLYLFTMRITAGAKDTPKVDMENVELPMSAYGGILKALDEYSIAHPNFEAKLTEMKIKDLQLYDKNAQFNFFIANGGSVADFNRIEKNCSPAYCWLNIVTDVTQEKLEQFFHSAN